MQLLATTCNYSKSLSTPCNYLQLFATTRNHLYTTSDKQHMQSQSDWPNSSYLFVSSLGPPPRVAGHTSACLSVSDSNFVSDLTRNWCLPGHSVFSFALWIKLISTRSGAGMGNGDHHVKNKTQTFFFEKTSTSIFDFSYINIIHQNHTSQD